MTVGELKARLALPAATDDMAVMIEWDGEYHDPGPAFGFEVEDRETGKLMFVLTLPN